MADNVGYTPGTGASVAADDIGGNLHQRIKISVGPDGSATDLAAGQATMANSLPVAIASDQSTVPISGTVTTNAGANLNTSALALEAGGNLATIAASLSVIDDWDETDRAKVNLIAGQVGVQGNTGVVTALTQRVVLATDVALPAGTNAIGKLSANSGVDIGDVDVASVSGNVTIVQATGTNLHAVIDSGAVAATQSGVWTVQPGNTANTTAWKVDGSAVTQPVSAASLPLPTGAATAAKQDTGNTSLASIDGKVPALGQALAASSTPVVLTAAQITTLTPPAAITGFATEATLSTLNGKVTAVNTGAVTISAALPAGANAIGKLAANSGVDIGDVDVASVSGNVTVVQGTGTNLHAVVDSGVITTVGAVTAITNALPAGTNAIGKLSANSGVDIGDVDVASVAGNVTVVQSTASNLNAQVVGAVAHDAAVSGNPLLIAGEAKDALGTAVTAGDVCRIATNRYGMKLVSTIPPSHASSNGTPITATTTGVIAAPAASSHLRIVRIHLSNGGSTSTWVAIRDGAAGTQYYRTYLPQNGVISLNLNSSGPLDLTSATRLDIVLSAAGSVEYQIDYLTVAD